MVELVSKRGGLNRATVQRADVRKNDCQSPTVPLCFRLASNRNLSNRRSDHYFRGSRSPNTPSSQRIARSRLIDPVSTRDFYQHRSYRESSRTPEGSPVDSIRRIANPPGPQRGLLSIGSDGTANAPGPWRGLLSIVSVIFVALHAARS